VPPSRLYGARHTLLPGSPRTACTLSGADPDCRGGGGSAQGTGGADTSSKLSALRGLEMQ
jgi:hypothetical protein